VRARYRPLRHGRSRVVKITGRQVFSAKLRDISGRGKDAEIGKALYAGGDLISDYAQGSIVAGSVTGKNHIPSAPGEAPNADQRTLDKNIEVVQINPLLVEVSSNAPYSEALETGTSKMAPRPFMGPAVQAKKNEVIALVGKAVDHILSGGTLR